MEALLAVLVVAAAAVVAVVAIRRGLATRPSEPRPRPWTDQAVAGETVVLDLNAADPEDAAVQRLVREAGHQALRTQPDAERVEVISRDGTRLGVVERARPLRDIDVPEVLSEPHATPHRTPEVVRGERPRHPGRPSEDDLGDEPSPRRRPFADRFELPTVVEAELADRHNPVELVRAILAAAGHEPEVDRDLIKVGDLAIVVVPISDGPSAALNHAFMRCQEARTSQGLVIRLGWVNAEELRPREAAAPWVRHVDSDAIQRMADAVALGADPIAFAVGPRVVG